MIKKNAHPVNGHAEPPDGENIGYARVSTDDQRLDLQIDALKRVNCLLIHEEKGSAAGKKRPVLDRVLRVLRPGDTLCVWRLDRFARSMRDLLNRLQQIEEAGARFRSLTEGFDTVTANGRLILMMLGALAEFERQLTVERTKAGIASARARGIHIGAKQIFTPDKRAKAVEMMNAFDRSGEPKYSTKEIAKALGVSVSTINNRMPGGRAAYLNR